MPGEPGPKLQETPMAKDNTLGVDGFEFVEFTGPSPRPWPPGSS